MSRYADELGIKSVISLNKWFKDKLEEVGIKVDLECVKVDSYVYVFWAKDNQLYKHSITCSVIYVLKEEQLLETLEIIKTSL